VYVCGIRGYWGGKGQLAWVSAHVRTCLTLLPLLSKLTGKRLIKSFGVFRILLNHSHVVNPKQANDTTLDSTNPYNRLRHVSLGVEANAENGKVYLTVTRCLLGKYKVRGEGPCCITKAHKFIHLAWDQLPQLQHTLSCTLSCKWQSLHHTC